tara:strand:+ start:31035 stop:31478 length:444 start_codon:yes stop_codon:yes gene_type:complete
MSEQEYITTRIDDQLKWFRKKSAANKNYNYRIKGFIIICSMLIPLIAGLENMSVFLVSYNRIILGCLGAIVAILAGIASLMRFHEKWLNYRNTAEKLKREKFFFETSTEPYNKPGAFNLLVKRVEDILNTENTDWNNLVKEDIFKAE